MKRVLRSGRRAEAARKLQIYLLGRMQITTPNHGESLHLGRKPRALLAYLCLTQGELVPRTRLMELFWGRSATAQARLSLRNALAQLRTTLLPSAPRLFDIQRETVRLDPREVWIDARDIPGAPGRLFEDLTGVSAAFDAWAKSERHRFEVERREVLERALDRLIAAAVSPRARLAGARRLLAADPVNESAMRAMIGALVEMGDRGDAVHEYRRHEQALRALDLPPALETTALYSAALGTAEPASKVEHPPAARLPLRGNLPSSASSRPILAVMPLRDLSPTGSFLGAALHEELLSRFGSLPDIPAISRLDVLDTGGPISSQSDTVTVRYVLSGSIQEVKGRFRVTAELSDRTAGTVVWRAAYDGAATAVLELRQRLAHRIATDAVPALRTNELRLAHLKDPGERDAYHLFVCARDGMHSLSRTAFEESGSLFDQAVDRDPDFAEALSTRALWHLLRVGQGWSSDPAADIAAAKHSVRLAIERAPHDPLAFAIQGHVAAYLRKDFATAFDSIHTALRLDPNLAVARLWSAAANAYVGRADRAVEEIERALALSPYDPQRYAFTSIASLAYLAAGRFDQAVSFGRRAMTENPGYTTAHKLLAMSLALSDRHDEASVVVEDLLRLEPDFCVDLFRSRSPGTASELGQIYCEALEKAGVPRFGR